MATEILENNPGLPDNLPDDGKASWLDQPPDCPVHPHESGGTVHCHDCGRAIDQAPDGEEHRCRFDDISLFQRGRHWGIGEALNDLRNLKAYEDRGPNCQCDPPEHDPKYEDALRRTLEFLGEPRKHLSQSDEANGPSFRRAA